MLASISFNLCHVEFYATNLDLSWWWKEIGSREGRKVPIYPILQFLKLSPLFHTPRKCFFHIITRLLASVHFYHIYLQQTKEYGLLSEQRNLSFGECNDWSLNIIVCPAQDALGQVVSTMFFAHDLTNTSAFVPRDERKEAKIVCPTRLGKPAEEWSQDHIWSTVWQQSRPWS